jgi:hypothetical protein
LSLLGSSGTHRTILECRGRIRTARTRGRVKRDYTRGAITAEDWHDLRPDLEMQLAAAVGELEQLREQSRATDTTHLASDAEQQVLEHLAAIRASIQSQVAGSATSLDSIRATLQRLFQRFESPYRRICRPHRCNRARRGCEDRRRGRRSDPASHSAPADRREATSGVPWWYENGSG